MTKTDRLALWAEMAVSVGLPLFIAALGVPLAVEGDGPFVWMPVGVLAAAGVAYTARIARAVGAHVTESMIVAVNPLRGYRIALADAVSLERLEYGHCGRAALRVHLRGGRRVVLLGVTREQLEGIRARAKVVDRVWHGGLWQLLITTGVLGWVAVLRAATRVLAP